MVSIPHEGSDERTSAVIAEVERLVPELIRLATSLVRTRSVNPRYPGAVYASDVGGETACARLLADYLATIGAETTVIERETGRGNVGARIRGHGSGRSLVINGHFDTVAAADIDAWTDDPWSGTVRDGRIFGLGSTDMKGPIAASVIAAQAATTIAGGLRGDVVFQYVAGEETGEAELGTLACIEQGFRADAGLCVEPTGFETAGSAALAVAPVALGTLVFRVTLGGRTVHAGCRREAIYPHEGPRSGVSAFEKGLVITSALAKLEQTWGFTKKSPFYPAGQFILNPGVVHSGPRGTDSALFLADHFVAEYGVYYPPEDDRESVKTEIRDCIERAADQDEWLATHRPQLDWVPAIPASHVDVSHPLVQTVRAAANDVTGVPAVLRGLTAGCDAAWLCGAGVPTLVYGPGHIADAHSVDESISIAELTEAAKTIAVTILRFCDEPS